MTNYEGILNNLIEELDDNKKTILSEKYPEDLIHEYVDSWIPVYNRDLLDCLSSDYSLATVEDEGLLPEKPDVFKIIQVAMYEKLYNEAREWLEQQTEDEELDD